jgi:hypothetical protein
MVRLHVGQMSACGDMVLGVVIGPHDAMACRGVRADHC